MTLSIGRSDGVADVEKEQVTQQQRVNPLGANPSTANPRSNRLSAAQLRIWADTSEWVHAAINHRRVQVSRSEWSIAPIDDEAPINQSVQAQLELLFARPNAKQRTFRELIEPLVEDLLVLDAGVIEKDLNSRGIPQALILVDAPFMRIRPDWTGAPEEARFEWWPQNRFASSLTDQQVIYMMQSPTSHRTYGFSPLEALKKTIDADMEAADYNTRNVKQVSPDGILNLGENVGPDQLDKFRAYYDSEVAGRKRMAMMAGAKNPQFINTGQSARDMQFMQWQVYLLRKIAAVFGVSPQDLGITFDVNRANAQAQQEISEDRGLKPLLSLIEEQFNEKVVGDFTRREARRSYDADEIDFSTFRAMIALSMVNPRDHKQLFKNLRLANSINLSFCFRLRSSKSVRDQAEINNKSLGGLPWRTVNEVRDDDGQPPVEGGDEIVVPTPIGPLPLAVLVGEDSPVGREQTEMLQHLLGQPPISLNTTMTTPDEKEIEYVEVPVYVDEHGDPIDD